MTLVQARTALLTRILLGAIVACVALSTAWWLHALFSSHEGDREPVEVTIPDVSSVQFGGGADYPALLERPLFWPERAPAPPGATATANGTEAAAGVEGLVYLGVILKGEQRQVLFKDGDNVQVLHEGEKIRGLEIRRISTAGVTLSGSNGDVTLPVPVDNADTIEFRRTE
jgi:hypothetical protein